METGRISEKIDRGKHTTRHSELFRMEENSYIFDTPGFSSLEVPEMPKEELRYYFPEFTLYEGQCPVSGMCTRTGTGMCGKECSGGRQD